MSSLYDIDYRLRMLEEGFVDSETGEIIETEEEFYELFDKIQMDLSEKVENTMLFYKNLISDCSQIEEEEKRLKQRRKAKEALAERLKNRIDTYIVNTFTDENGNINSEGLNAYKFETPRLKLSYRRSTVVDILDQDKVPQEFLKTKVEVSVDKAKAKKIISSGQQIEGLALKDNYNMQVK